MFGLYWYEPVFPFVYPSVLVSVRVSFCVGHINFSQSAGVDIKSHLLIVLVYLFQGEARVLKHLEPGRVDVKARRKKIQRQMEEQSLYHKQKKILDFIADGTTRKVFGITKYVGFWPTSWH